MTPFECYCEYVAIKQHFGSHGYDYHKYKGKSQLKKATFEKRKDRIFFEKLAKHPDITQFLVANFITNPKLWVRDLAYSESAERTYQDWIKRQQTLTYNFKQELKKLLASHKFNELLLVVDGRHPPLFSSYLGKEVSLETLCIILNVSATAIKHWDENLPYDPLWEETRKLVMKYTPFMVFDRAKMAKTIVDTVTAL